MQFPRKRNITQLEIAIGIVIRAARKRHKLSGRELATKANMTKECLYHIERGEVGCTVAMLNRIAAIFDVPLWRILFAAQQRIEKKP